MRVISAIYPGALLVIFFLLPALSPAQHKKPEAKTVCSVTVPSRFAAIHYKKAGTAPIHTVPKKLSCCKGIPSRFVARPVATRQIKNS